MAAARRYDGAIMMARTQISLDAELLRRAKAKAGDLGISLAEYVRRVVEDDLGPGRSGGDASAIFGLFDSGGSDVSTQKDAYVGEALAAEHRRTVDSG